MPSTLRSAPRHRSRDQTRGPPLPADARPDAPPHARMLHQQALPTRQRHDKEPSAPRARRAWLRHFAGTTHQKECSPGHAGHASVHTPHSLRRGAASGVCLHSKGGQPSPPGGREGVRSTASRASRRFVAPSEPSQGTPGGGGVRVVCHEGFVRKSCAATATTYTPTLHHVADACWSTSREAHKLWWVERRPRKNRKGDSHPGPPPWPSPPSPLPCLPLRGRQRASIERGRFSGRLVTPRPMWRAPGAYNMFYGVVGPVLRTTSTADPPLVPQRDPPGGRQCSCAGRALCVLSSLSGWSGVPLSNAAGRLRCRPDLRRASLVEAPVPFLTVSGE